MALCASCGKENAEDARFCSACGSLLGGEPEETRERRKRVTVVFCDLTGSTAMGERLDSETLRQVMTRYYAAMRSALERHGGTVEKFIGDAVMAVFGVPTLHEDDALRAVRARPRCERPRRTERRAPAALGVELRPARASTPARSWPEIPPAVSRSSSGDAVNVAARLEQRRRPTRSPRRRDHRLVRDAVKVEEVEPLTPRGNREPVRAFRLVEVTAQASGVARRLDAPLVGREHELAALEHGFDRAVREKSVELITVLGPREWGSRASRTSSSRG